MSWSNGSTLFGNIAGIIRDVVTNESEKKILYHEMILEFGDYDCDTLDECLGIDPILDEILQELLEIE
jgi:hypothetical protein